MHKTLPLFGLLVLVGAVGARPPVTPGKASFNWPQWRGPDRTDVSKETGLLKDWTKEAPKLLWTFREAGVGYSGMSVVGERLYTLGSQDNQEYLFAIDLTTQKEAWKTDIGALLVNGYGDGPRSTPTVVDGFVYAISGKGNVVCLQAADGKLLWTTRMVEDLGGGVPGWGYTESPLVDGDKVIVTPGGKKGTIAALDRKTGKVVWQTKDLNDGTQYSSVVIGSPAGVRQYIQLTGDHVVGVEPTGGKVLWKYDRKGSTATIPTPVVKGDYVYVTSGYGVGCNLAKISGTADTGFKAEEVYANKTMQNHHGGVLLVGDDIYGYSDRGGWMCQDLLTGKEVWKNNGVGKGGVTCADGMLYCYGERNGDVALVEVNPTAYVEHGRFTIPEKTKLPRKSGSIWTHPTVANGKLYLRDQDLIFCYDVSAK